MASAAIPRELKTLAAELSDKYLVGSLRIVAGAGISRASGLPSWRDMADSLETYAASESGLGREGLSRILSVIHGDEIIGRTDTIRRLLGGPAFARGLHQALYGGDPPVPSPAHWHLASLMDVTQMPDLYTSNFDDLLEIAHKVVGTGGRIRHFHGKLPIQWNGERLYRPPIVTTRDYVAAERGVLYEPLAADLADKTVLLIGVSLADPNLVRLVRENSGDCRALLVVSRKELSAADQELHLRLLKGFWQDQQVKVVAAEAYEHVPGFLMELRRQIASKRGKSWFEAGERAWSKRIVASPTTTSGLQALQESLARLVKAAKASDPRLRRDRELNAGLFLIDGTGWLVHAARSGVPTDRFSDAPKRRLNADANGPWGVAGYAFAAGIPSAATTSGSAFDRNVPRETLLEWQRERASEGRLPPASVLCVPVWCAYGRRYQPVGVIYLASSDGAAFEGIASEPSQMVNLLSAAAESMIRATPDPGAVT
jgi:hypothetical protein